MAHDPNIGACMLNCHADQVSRLVQVSIYIFANLPCLYCLVICKFNLELLKLA